jgi:hypothetical protein
MPSIEPLLQGEQQYKVAAESSSSGCFGKCSDAAKPYSGTCLKACGGIGGVVFLVVALVQLSLYYWACMKCGAHHLQGYEYPGGGPYNLVMSETALIVKNSRWGWTAEVWPVENGMLTGAASLGTIWRTWGPMFYTYTFEDNNGMYTWVVRDRPIALGGSHKMMRCDGTGDPWIYNEGKRWLSNKFWEILGAQVSSEYEIWNGTEEVATTRRVGGIGPDANSQLNFKMVGHVNRFASSALHDTTHHGHKLWMTKIDRDKTTVPNWIPVSITSLFAIHLGEKFHGTGAHADQSQFLVKSDGQGLASVELLPIAAAEPEGAAAAPKATGTSGCCYSIGYGAMMVPCCLTTTEGVEERACETGKRMGGATGWVEGACPKSAEEAAGLLNPEVSASNDALLP